MLVRTVSAILCVCVGLVPVAHADEANAAPPAKEKFKAQDQPAVITADEIVQDRDFGSIIARGHVEIDQGGRILKADTVTYMVNQDAMIATGNVSLTDATEEVTFADYMELSGDMREAAAKQLRILQMDDSRIAAASGRRFAGQRNIMNKGVYTACQPCADANKAPVWQIKGDLITDNEENHLVEYQDAWLEILGYPVAYTPYLSHPDPTVKRESGLLPPSVINNQIIGSGIRLPYFIVLDPQQDVTLTPMVTTTNDTGLGVTQRWRSDVGQERTSFSVTDLPGPGYAGKSTIGWYVDAVGRFDVSPDWRIGYKADLTSSLDYLEAFGYQHPLPYMEIHPYAEDFGYRNYFIVEGYSFQSLSNPVLPAGAVALSKDPVVFPEVTYSFVGAPDTNGAYWTIDTHGAVVSRLSSATNTRQLNTMTNWNLPYQTSDGEQLRFSLGLRADAYNADHPTSDSTGEVVTGRALPVAAVDWRFPFTQLGQHSQQTITPIVMAAASPYGANPSKIPDEDSLDFELNDNNIFSPNPSIGYDRVVSGPRVAYGGEYTLVNRGSQAADILIGQSYQVEPQTGFPAGSGLDHNRSDIVGRANISPSGNFSAQYSFRLNEKNYEAERQEVSTLIGPRMLNLQTSYVFLDRLNPNDPFDQREQLSSTLTTQWSRTWQTQLYTIENLGQQAGPLESGIRLTYEDECFLLTADAGDRHTTSKVFSAGHYFTLRIVFKTLGQLPVDIF
jgi:LPS-assembly protein